MISNLKMVPALLPTSVLMLSFDGLVEKLKKITIKGGGNVANRLSQRVEEFEDSFGLQLHLTVDLKSWKQLDTSTFLDALSSAEIITFELAGSDKREFDEFFIAQKPHDFFDKQTPSSPNSRNVIFLNSTF